MKLLAFIASCFLLSACAVIPNNLDSQNQDNNGAFKRVVVESLQTRSVLMGAESSKKIWWAEPEFKPLSELDAGIKLGRGDMLDLKSQALSSLSGRYQINQAGAIDLPFVGSFEVAGLSVQAAISKLQNWLVSNKWLERSYTTLQISVVDYGSVSVQVEGAVFNQGSVVIGVKSKALPQTQILQDTGFFNRDRSLAEALQRAGGLRPDADMARIYLNRQGRVYRLSLDTLLGASEIASLPYLQNGDRIFVASIGYEQIDLIRPTAVTPPGMRVFLSNLTAPALSNAQSSIGNDSNRVPYGVSLIDVAVSANCVGGTQMANASRSVVLITRNYGSMQQIVISRSINELLQHASNHDVNPFVMPNDAVACYDSKFTNFRDVARGLGELISPILLGRLL